MPSAGIRKNRWSRFGGNNWEFHLRCVLDIQVKRSFIAAGYMSLEFKRGVQAGDINLEVFSLKLNF